MTLQLRSLSDRRKCAAQIGEIDTSMCVQPWADNPDHIANLDVILLPTPCPRELSQ